MAFPPGTKIPFVVEQGNAQGPNNTAYPIVTAQDPATFVGNITLAGDTTGPANANTTAKVNGVAYPAAPAVGSVPVVTSAGQVTYQNPQIQNGVVAYFPYPNLQSHKVKWFNGEAPNNTATPAVGGQYSGWSTLTFNNIAAAASPAFSAATLLGSTKRIRFQTVAATAFVGLNETGYINAGITQWGVWRGNAAGRGGFFFRARFALTNIGATSTVHGFFGLLDAVAQQAATYDYLSGVTAALVGMGFTFTSTGGSVIPANNWQLIQANRNAPVLIDTGIQVVLNDFIELIMFCPQNGNAITVQVNNLTTGVQFNATMNQNLPDNTTPRLLAMQCVMGVQSIAAGTDAIDISLMYLEDFDG